MARSPSEWFADKLPDRISEPYSAWSEGRRDAKEPTPIRAAMSLDDVDVKIAQLEKLRQQAEATLHAEAQLQGLHNRVVDEGIAKINQYYDAKISRAQQDMSHQQKMSRWAFGSTQGQFGTPQGSGGIPGPSRVIQANTNQTQQEVVQQRMRHAQGDDFEMYPSSENMRLRDVAKNVMHGNLRTSQAFLAPGALLYDALREGRLTKPGQAGIDPATGHTMARQAGAIFGSGIGRNLARAGVGVGGLFAATQGIPYALEGIERGYNRFIGDDISYGQQAGFSGGQGVGAAGMGLLNRAIEPLNLLTGLIPGGDFLNIGPFGSSAQKFGSQRRLEAFRAGFNPFDALSIKEAEGIQREVLNRGYRVGSRQERDVISGLQRLRNTTGADPGQALDYIDVFVKKFNFATDDIIDDLEGFAESAQAAGKSVDQFTKEVSAVAQAAIARGVRPDEARNLAQGYASISGVPAEGIQAGAQNASNPLLLLSALQRDPNLFSNPAKAMLYLTNPEAALGDESGGSFVDSVRRAIDLVKQFPGSEGLTTEQLALLAKDTLRIPGLDQLDAGQIAKIYKEGDSVDRTVDRTRALTDLSTASDRYTRLNQRESGLRGSPGGASPYTPKNNASAALTGQLDQFYRKYLQTVKAENLSEDQYAEIEDMARRRVDPSEINQQVNRFIAENAGDISDTRVETRLLVDASPELKRYLSFIEQEENRNYLDGTTARTAGDRNRPNPADRTGPPLVGSRYRP